MPGYLGQGEIFCFDAQTGIDLLGDFRIGTEEFLGGFLALADAFALEGRPGEVIVAKAVELGADLIVVGSHGRRGLNRMMLGSVSDAVVGAARCAVLVAKPAVQSDELLSAIAPEL